MFGRRAKIKYNLVVTFHMKSGENILVECDDISIKTTGNDLVSYDLQGVRKGTAMYIRLDDVSAITYVRR